MSTAHTLRESLYGTDRYVSHAGFAPHRGRSLRSEVTRTRTRTGIYCEKVSSTTKLGPAGHYHAKSAPQLGTTPAVKYSDSPLTPYPTLTHNIDAPLGQGIRFCSGALPFFSGTVLARRLPSPWREGPLVHRWGFALLCPCAWTGSQ